MNNKNVCKQTDDVNQSELMKVQITLPLNQPFKHIRPHIYFKI